ncbi:MAG: zinc ribbon domain-containing protein [Candidatus Heimdallarchaeaceae archaeon]
MSEEFVRCPNCGNLNIKGAKTCIFCDTEITEDADIVKEHIEEYGGEYPSTDVPSTTGVPSVPSVTGDVPQAEQKETKVSVEKKAAKKQKVKDELLEKRLSFSLGKKFLIISLYGLLISLAHYALNLLVAFLSIDIKDPNIDVYPTLPANLSSSVSVSTLTVILGVPFIIIIGYAFGKLVRNYSKTSKGVQWWISYMILLDVILHAVVTIILVAITNATAEKDILLIILVGAVLIFFLLSVFTLFIPMLIGSFLLFNKFDQLYFSKESSKH